MAAVLERRSPRSGKRWRAGFHPPYCGLVTIKQDTRRSPWEVHYDLLQPTMMQLWRAQLYFATVNCDHRHRKA